MAKQVRNAAASDADGDERFKRNLRKVLQRRGFTGARLEAKLAELMRKNVRQLALMVVRPN